MSIAEEIGSYLALETDGSRLATPQEEAILRAILGVEALLETPRLTPANLVLFGPQEAEVLWRKFSPPLICRCEMPEHKTWVFVFQILNVPALKPLLAPSEDAIA
jgi:hypothetical protein